MNSKNPYVQIKAHYFPKGKKNPSNFEPLYPLDYQRDFPILILGRCTNSLGVWDNTQKLRKTIGHQSIFTIYCWNEDHLCLYPHFSCKLHCSCPPSIFLLPSTESQDHRPPLPMKPNIITTLPILEMFPSFLPVHGTFVSENVTFSVDQRMSKCAKNKYNRILAANIMVSNENWLWVTKIHWKTINLAICLNYLVMKCKEKITLSPTCNLYDIAFETKELKEAEQSGVLSPVTWNSPKMGKWAG